MGTKANVGILAITLYSIYYGYIITVRSTTISRRKARAVKAKQTGDLETLQDSSPEEQYGVMIVAGRFSNPFPEYREQGIFEFIFWKFYEILRFTPRGGIPRDRSLLNELIPVYRPDFELLFELSPLAAGSAVAKTESNQDMLLSGNASPAGLTSSVTSAIYYSSDTGSSSNIPLDSLTESWTPISQRYVTATPSMPTQETHFMSDTSSNTTSSASHSPAVDGSTATPEGIPSRDERITVTWIGQSCMFVQCGGINIITDPIFGNSLVNKYVGPQRLVVGPCALEDLPPADYVIVSHNHPDHFEASTVAKIGNSAMWIVPIGVRPFLARRGIYRVTEMKWWDKISFPGRDRDDWEIACTPAMHWSGRHLFDCNASLWCSFMILHNGRPMVFHAGDTGYSTTMFTSIAQVYGTGCEIALLPVGAYCPEFHLRPIHSSPPDAMNIMRDLGARRLLGVHWGTFVMSDEYFLEPRIKLDEYAAAHDMQNAVFAAEFGRTVVVPIQHSDEHGTSPDDDAAFRLPDAGVSNVQPLKSVEGKDTLVW
ncbi:beta-lactamase superfamily domain-containing protein [Lipomyces arxii]|uniref:beta-lactamase superfamily domain-containing protein n=1 Tax=Lipomyces arxii TaxID=56418 RepID=UPI0034CF81CF